MLQSVSKLAPAFAPYARSCYGSPAALFSDGFMLSSEEGEHQGCPCGPLFFAITLAEAMRTVPSQVERWSHWYLDDGYIAGPLSALDAFLPQVEEAALKVGLRLNRAKSAVLLSDDGPVPECLVPGVPRVRSTECARVLGTPVGGRMHAGFG